MCVQHPAGSADQLRCTACGLAFELEMDGARLHVSRWPDSLPFLHIMVSDDWRSAADLRSLVKQMTSGSNAATPPPATAPIQPLAPIPPAESETAAVMPPPAPAAAPKPAAPALDATAIGIRIKQLRTLGNSSKEIRTTLTQAEKDPERVQAILGMIDQMERYEQARQGNKLAWSLGILMVVVILLVGAGYIWQTNFLNQNQPAAGGAGGPAGAPAQPTQAPNIAVKILNLNTPVVNYGSVPPGASSVSATACPRTAQQAADSFGGKPTDWYYPPGSNGWVMAHAGGGSVNIFVPKGMKAAYLQLSNRLQLNEVAGPATMTDVYYVAISCP